ncbi:hypothetical protein ACSQ67_024377 [Phaseolus vulgaris]
MSVTERTHEEKGKVPLVGVKSRKHKVDLTHQRKWSVYGICRDCFLDEISIDSLSIKQSKKSEVQLASLIWMKTCKRLFTVMEKRLEENGGTCDCSNPIYSEEAL